VAPVLTEKAVQAAAVVENSQVFVAIFWPFIVRVIRESTTGSSSADPVGNTIGGQGIIIPGIAPLPGRRRKPLSVPVFPHSTVPYRTFSDEALVEAVAARDASRFFGRTMGESESLS
jgi:hypothetical protein